MRTALVTHGWLDHPQPEYRDRRIARFMHHYQGCWPTIYLDNGSSVTSCVKTAIRHGIDVRNLMPHYPRGSMLDYPNVWRAYWTLKDVLQEYDRVFFFATDAYVLSQRLLDYLDGITEGWVALWSPKYNFPADEISVICRGCEAFEQFFAGECDPFKYNGRITEITLPLTHVEKGFVGDRFSEYHHTEYVPPLEEMDYYTQAPDDDDFQDETRFPVVRRIDGKLTIVTL